MNRTRGFFVIGGLLLWLPVMLLLALVITGIAMLKIPVPAAAKHEELTAACSFFGITYFIISIPVVFFLGWLGPRSRLQTFALAFPFSLVIPMLAIVVLLPTFYYGLYAVAFTVMTWNFAPFLWAVMVAELRWRIDNRNSGADAKR